MKYNILIPMAGSGKRFLKAGYKQAKPLIEVNGKTMIQRVIENLTPKRREHKFFFICMADHLTPELLEIMRATKDYEIIALSSYTEGATCSALKANLEPGPVLLASCDQIVDIKIDDFLDYVHGLDGALITYKTNKENHSYCLTRGDKVIKVVEKQVVSPHGNVGIYYFGDSKIFKEAAEQMIEKDIRYNNEFYNSLIYNEITGNVEIYEITPNEAHQIGTPEELNDYQQRSN